MVFFLIAVFVFALFFLWLLNRMVNGPECIEGVDAGPASNVNPQDLVDHRSFEPMGVYRTPDGKILTSERYRRVAVVGSCMEPRGIKQGDKLLVEKRRDGEQLQINQGDILLIYLKDRGFYKIRAYEGETEDGTAYNTYYYDDNGQKKDSSQPHKKESVEGIVRYVLP